MTKTIFPSKRQKMGVILLTLITLSMAFLFYACKKTNSIQLVKKSETNESSYSSSQGDPTKSSPNKSDQTPKKLFLRDFMYIGEQHNEGLDFILKKMIAERRKGNVNSFDREFVVNAIIELTHQDLKQRATATTLQIEKSRMLNVIDSFLKEEATAVVYAMKSLNDTQKKYAATLLNTAANNYPELVQHVEKVIKNIQASELTIEEQGILFGMAAVALKSAEYWGKNEYLWNIVKSKSTNQYNNMIHPAKWFLSDILGKDAAGFGVGFSVTGMMQAGVALGVAFSALHMLENDV